MGSLTGIAIKITPAQWDSDADRVVILAGIAADTAKMVGEGKTARWVLTEWENKRSLDQNDKMQAMIRQINRNQGWGLSQTNAKNIITAECFGSKVVNGHEVYCSTSQLNTQQMSTLIEWMAWYCDENGIPTLEGHTA